MEIHACFGMAKRLTALAEGNKIEPVKITSHSYHNSMF